MPTMCCNGNTLSSVFLVFIHPMNRSAMDYSNTLFNWSLFIGAVTFYVVGYGYFSSVLAWINPEMIMGRIETKLTTIQMMKIGNEPSFILMPLNMRIIDSGI
mgnify:CR=1 FL=1